MSTINPEDIIAKKHDINNDFIIYIGIKTSPDCIKMIKKIYSLKDIFEDDSYTFYYFNVDEFRNYFDFQEALDLYKIEFIPRVITKQDCKEYILNYNDIMSIKGDFKLE